MQTAQFTCAKPFTSLGSGLLCQYRVVVDSNNNRLEEREQLKSCLLTLLTHTSVELLDGFSE